MVGGEERKMFWLFAAEDESCSELEGVGCAELMDAEEADGAGADFIGWNNLGPMNGQFVEMTAGPEFQIAKQFTGAFAPCQ